MALKIYQRLCRSAAIINWIILFFLFSIPPSEAIDCPKNLSILADSLIHNSTIRFRFLSDGKSSQKNLTIEYWVEDISGEIVNTKKQSSNLGWKTYTPNAGDSYALYVIKAVLVQPGCSHVLTAEQYAIFKNPSPQNPDNPKQRLICKPVKEGISIYLDHVPKTALSGEEFSILASIENHDNLTRQVKVYSYIYRASKTYSQSKNSNLEEIELKPGESMSFKLSNLANLTPGNYRLKLVAEYLPNKTKEIATNLTFIAKESRYPKIKISHFGISSLSKQELTAEINSTSREQADLLLIMESDTYRSETELTLQPEEKTELKFPLIIPLARNHIFLKLYLNSSLIDVSELVLENRSAKDKEELPFTLVSGDLVLNTSQRIYSSSSARSAGLVPIIILAASLALNGYFMFMKKKD